MNASNQRPTLQEIQLFQAMPGNSALLLPDPPVFTIVAITQGFAETFGYLQKDNLIEKGLFEAFPKSRDNEAHTGEKELRASLDQVFSSCAAHLPAPYRYDIQKDDAFEEHWWSAVNRPVIDEKGDIRYIIHAAEDVTVKVKTEQRNNRVKELEKSHNLFMQAPVAIGIAKGSEYIIEMANDNLLEVWGRSADVVGKPLFEAVPELSGQGYRELLDQVRETGEPFYGYEHPVRLNRGGKEEVFYFDFVYKPYYENGNNKPAGVFTVGHNVTFQVEARQKFKSVIEEAKSPILILMGEDMVLDTANQALFDLWQVGPEAIGKKFLDILPEMKDQGFLELLQNVFYTGEPFYGKEIPAVFKRKSGVEETVYFDFSYQPYRSAEGTITGVLVMATDITEQVSAKRKLEESEKELQRIFTQAPVSMVVYKGENLIVQVASQIALDLWGKTEEEVIGRPFFDISPELREGQERLFQQVRETGEPFVAKEFPVHYIQYGKPHFIYYDFVFQPLQDENGKITAVVSIGNDVTHSVEARKKIEESESRFRTLAETLPQMIWVTDDKGKIEYYSHQWQLYSGINNTDEAWKYMIHPDDEKMSTAAYQKAYADGEPFRYEVRLKNSQGEYRWHYSIAEPVKDEEGKVKKWVGSLSDIHDQKNLTVKLEGLVADRTKELAEVNKSLQRSNEDLQQFAHVASHDLKEPVRKVLTFSSRLKDELGKNISERVAMYLSKIDGAAVRMYSMIDGVLLYSSLNALEQTKEQIDLEELMENIQSDLEVLIVEKKATFRYSNLPAIEGSAILIYQLFYNLVNNSLKFSKEGVPPVIGIVAEKATSNEISKAGINNGRDYVKLQLQDNGIGFRNEEATKIFATFTRLHTKDRYEGTGLGLSLCRKIVERHEGAIWAEGKQGEGATFTILLPVD
jgi:PAS domain S-box-containing protein